MVSRHPGTGPPLFLLDRAALTGGAVAVAIVAAVVGSFSLLQGLLIWPIGLLLICVRRRPARFLVMWISLGLITVILYFHNLNSYQYSDQTYPFTHPGESIQYFLFLIGSILGVQTSISSGPIVGVWCDHLCDRHLADCEVSMA